ncbi:MAG: penicillin-binding protein activator LpoB [Planctomycetaceae bacterium]|nr:penicillin-binding protein activator LpoB [Planctomycetaceae bacterium]
MLSLRMSFTLLLLTTMILCGCRGKQHAHVLTAEDDDMVGSHAAGAETWKPLIAEAVGRMMARSDATIHQASHTVIDGNVAARRVCFVGVENRSSEEIGDFLEQIYEHVDSLIGQDPHFSMISRRVVEAAMLECRCTPNSLLIPANQRQLQAVLERADQPFDYLLFARITSGTTNSNGDYQRNYLLTLELVDIHTQQSIKEHAELRKGYHKSILGRIKHYGD